MYTWDFEVGVDLKQLEEEVAVEVDCLGIEDRELLQLSQAFLFPNRIPLQQLHQFKILDCFFDCNKIQILKFNFTKMKKKRRKM